MRACRVLLIAVVASAGVIATGTPAGADCVGPYIDYPVGEVVPGDTITVTGEAFGSDCYDTGPPPEGEGTLGKPQARVDLYFAQGRQESAEPNSTADIRFETETLVATGSADVDYAFATQVTIPDGIAPGPAAIIARWGESGRSFDPLPLPLTVVASNSGPAEPVVEEVATFGPSDADATTTTTTEQELSLESDVVDGTTPLGPIVIAGAALLVVGGVVVFWILRRRRRGAA